MKISLLHDYSYLCCNRGVIKNLLQHRPIKSKYPNVNRNMLCLTESTSQPDLTCNSQLSHDHANPQVTLNTYTNTFMRYQQKQSLGFITAFFSIFNLTLQKQNTILSLLQCFSNLSQNQTLQQEKSVTPEIHGDVLMLFCTKGF